MHEERDRLVRFVFPEIRERCAKRRLHFIDVDLRWGITETEAENGAVLGICLDEIDRCHPFFIGLLAQRYGTSLDQYRVADEERFDWIHKIPLGCSMTTLEIYHGVLQRPAAATRALFYFRDPLYLASIGASDRSDFLPETLEAGTRLDALKTEIKQVALCRDYSTPNESFDAMVLNDLWAAILSEYPDSSASSEPEVADAYQEAFITHQANHLVGREDVLAELRQWCDRPSSPLLFLTGAPGSGKSATLAAFSRVLESNAEWFTIGHFIGASPGSTDVRMTLKRLCKLLARRCGESTAIPDDYEQLRQRFLNLLALAAKRSPVLIVIDGIDQLEDTNRGSTGEWLPSSLPTGVRLAIGAADPIRVDALRRRIPSSREIRLGALTAAEQERIVHRLLSQYRKTLTPDQLHSLLANPAAETALFLVIACEELRVAATFSTLLAMIAGFAQDVPSLLDQVLARLEKDHGSTLVREALSLLACAKGGLLESELLELLDQSSIAGFSRSVWARLYHSVRPYLRPTDIDAEGVLDYFHEQLRAAALKRYAPTPEIVNGLHEKIAALLQIKGDPKGTGEWNGTYPRTYQLLPVHQRFFASAERQIATLLNLAFIKQALKHLGIYSLIDHYPPGQESSKDMEALTMTGKALRLAAGILERDPAQLESQLIGRLGTYDDEEIMKVVIQAIDAARRHKLWPITAGLFHPRSPIERRFTRHVNKVTGVGQSSDHRFAVSSSADGSVRLWDLQTCEQIQMLKTQPDTPFQEEFGEPLWGIQQMLVALNGSRAICFDSQNMVIVDLPPFLEITRRPTHGVPTHATAGISPSGEFITISSTSYSSTEQTFVGGIDIVNGDGKVLVSHGIANRFRHVAVSDGARIVAGSYGRSHNSRSILLTFDARTLAKRGELQLDWPIDWMTFLPHGLELYVIGAGALHIYNEDLVLSASITLRPTGRSIGRPSVVAISPDGNRVARSFRNGTIEVWDLHRETSVCLIDEVPSVTTLYLCSGGQELLSGSDDGTITVHDVRQRAGQYKRDTRGPRCTAFATVGPQTIGIAGLDGVVRGIHIHSAETVWVLDHGKEFAIALAASEDGSKLLSCGVKIISLSEVKAGKTLYSWKADDYPGTFLAISMVEPFFRYAVIEVERSKANFICLDLETGGALDIPVHSSTADPLGWSADGREAWFITRSSLGTTELLRWRIPSRPGVASSSLERRNLQNCPSRGFFPSFNVYSGIYVDPRTLRIASRSNSVGGGFREGLTVYDLISDSVVQSIPTEDFRKKFVNHVVVDRDWSVALTASVSGEIECYDVVSSVSRFSNPAHLGIVTFMDIRSSGDIAVTGGRDRTVQVRRLSDGCEIGRFTLDNHPIMGRFLGEDRVIAVDAERFLHVLSLG